MYMDSYAKLGISSEPVRRNRGRVDRLQPGSETGTLVGKAGGLDFFTSTELALVTSTPTPIKLDHLPVEEKIYSVGTLVYKEGEYPPAAGLLAARHPGQIRMIPADIRRIKFSISTS